MIKTEKGGLLADRIGGWSTFSCPVEGPPSLGCAAYLAFEYRLVRGLFDDDLGELAREYVGGGASWQATIALLATPDSPWWDDVTTTDRTERRDDIVGAALDQAGRELEAAWGSDPARWTWGAMHSARFAEATLGSSGIGPIEWYFNRGPYPAPGAAGAVNNTYYRPSRAYPDPDDPSYNPVGMDGVFAITNLPSYRLSIDLGDLDGAQIVQTTGQSGNPFDRHYGDLIDEWLAGSDRSAAVQPRGGAQVDGGGSPAGAAVRRLRSRTGRATRSRLRFVQAALVWDRPRPSESFALRRLSPGIGLARPNPLRSGGSRLLHSWPSRISCAQDAVACGTRNRGGVRARRYGGGPRRWIREESLAQLPNGRAGRRSDARRPPTPRGSAAARPGPR